MTRLKLLLLPAVILAAPAAVLAQDWNDDSRVRGFERAPRVYWDGACRVTQRINADGELVERRRCRGDREAEQRAARADDDDAPRRHADDDAPRAYARRSDGYREPEPRYEQEPAPAPVYQAPAVQPVLRAPRIIAQGVPVAPARPAVKAPLPRAVAAVRPPQAVAKPAPAPRIALKSAPLLVPKPVIKPAAAPRVLARTVPPKPMRVAAAVKPAAKPAPVRVAVQPAPVQKRIAPAPMAARVAPAPAPAPRIVAKVQPVPKPVRVVARVVAVKKPVMEARQVAAKTSPLSKPAAAPVTVAARVAPPPKAAVPVPVQVVAKVEAPAPKPAAKAPLKSDWLVLLPAEEAKAESETPAVPDVEKSEPLAQARVYAKGESYLQSRAYREYVLRKRSDPYSNLR